MAVTDLDQKQGLTDRSASLVISKLTSFKNFSFYQGAIEKEEKEEPKTTPKKSKSLPLLIGVFALLVVILVLVVVFGTWQQF